METANVATEADVQAWDKFWRLLLFEGNYFPYVTHIAKKIFGKVIFGPELLDQILTDTGLTDVVGITSKDVSQYVLEGTKWCPESVWDGEIEKINYQICWCIEIMYNGQVMKMADDLKSHKMGEVFKLFTDPDKANFITWWRFWRLAIARNDDIYDRKASSLAHDCEGLIPSLENLTEIAKSLIYDTRKLPRFVDMLQKYILEEKFNYSESIIKDFVYECKARVDSTGAGEFDKVVLEFKEGLKEKSEVSCREDWLNFWEHILSWTGRYEAYSASAAEVFTSAVPFTPVYIVAVSKALGITDESLLSTVVDCAMGAKPFADEVQKDFVGKTSNTISDTCRDVAGGDFMLMLQKIKQKVLEEEV